MSIEDQLIALENRLRPAEDHLEILRLLNTYGPAVDSESAEAAAPGRRPSLSGLADASGLCQRTTWQRGPRQA